MRARVDDVVRGDAAGQANVRINRPGYRECLAVRELDEHRRRAPAEAGCERALVAGHRRDRDQAVIERRLDDQGRKAVRRIAANELLDRRLRVRVANLDAMPALGRKPAAIEAL